MYVITLVHVCIDRFYSSLTKYLKNTAYHNIVNTLSMSKEMLKLKFI
jgi:hypothetical protein